MRVCSFGRWCRLALMLFAAGCGGGGSGSDGGDASVADPAPHAFVLRWRAEPLAAGYVVHWGRDSGVYADALDVGAPTPDAAGVASFVLESTGAADVLYFALTSYDGTYRMSAFSNEIAVSVR